MTDDLQLFSEIFDCNQNHTIIISSGELCTITKIGNVIISPNIILYDVLYISNVNVLLVNKLVKD